MANENFTSFIKDPLSDKKRINKARITSLDQMPVGGYTLSSDKADKKYITLQFEKKHLSGEPIERKLVAKIFERLPATGVRKIVDTYGIARHEGFSVPATTRFFAYNDIYGSILMTDMSENGKYRVWGYNDSAKPEEEKVLNDMNLTGEDLQVIRGQVNNFVKLANGKRRSLHYYNYHIRQDIMSKKFEVFLLDLDTTFVDPTPLENLQEEADDFITILTLNRKERDSYLSKKPIRIQ